MALPVSVSPAVIAGAETTGTEPMLISCDWGTSAFRLRLLRGAEAPKIVAERSSLRGILTFDPRDKGEFHDYLTLEIERLFRRARISPAPVPVYLSGMITSSLGWKELPYVEVPFPLDGSRILIKKGALRRPCGTHKLTFVSGMRAADDVARGEETELIGIFSDVRLGAQRTASLVILPGTHSKAVEVRNGEVVGFRTYLTGELFQTLQQHTILRHSVSNGPAGFEEAQEFFDLGIRRASVEGMLGWLFTVRTNDLLKGIPRDLNRHYLSGLLIGDEISSILKSHRSATPILLCGSLALQKLYLRGLTVLEAGSRVHLVPEEVTSIAAALGHWRLAIAEYGPGILD